MLWEEPTDEFRSSPAVWQCNKGEVQPSDHSWEATRLPCCSVGRSSSRPRDGGAPKAPRAARFVPAKAATDRQPAQEAFRNKDPRGPCSTLTSDPIRCPLRRELLLLNCCCFCLRMCCLQYPAGERPKLLPRLQGLSLGPEYRLLSHRPKLRPIRQLRTAVRQSQFHRHL